MITLNRRKSVPIQHEHTFYAPADSLVEETLAYNWWTEEDFVACDVMYDNELRYVVSMSWIPVFETLQVVYTNDSVTTEEEDEVVV